VTPPPHDGLRRAGIWPDDTLVAHADMPIERGVAMAPGGSCGFVDSNDGPDYQHAGMIVDTSTPPSSRLR
jgi:hypothetical protein